VVPRPRPRPGGLPPPLWQRDPAAAAGTVRRVTAATWTVVIPVKPSARGKSRLNVSGVDRVALARAIALDTVAAAAACESVAQVVVVTDDGGLVIQAVDIPGLRFV